MRNISNHQRKKILTGGALVLAVTASVFADSTPAATSAAPPLAAPVTKSAADPGTLNSFFNGALPAAIGNSKILVNSRLRWEYADQSGLRAANAETLRTRFGITTAPLYGFQGMLEGENVTSLGNENDYNAAGSNPGGAGRTIIADPPTTELNQVWLSYVTTNYLPTMVKGGRQRIVLDNARFVGDVGWRQNQQTFDAATIESTPVKDLDVYYGYIWDVHRVFGNVSGLPAASPNHDFKSSSHLINVSYSGVPYAKLTGYTYLLDLDLNNGTATRYNNSCATYGGSITGKIPAGKKLSFDYRGEFAYQTDYAKSTVNYGADYYTVELSANVKPFVLGGGYEVIGSDNNQGFRTPLATLHAFDGWADVFLVTPALGLQDIYGFAQVTLPKIGLPIRFVYHKFDSDKGGQDYGQEFDAVVTKKLGKYWTAIAKYSHYDGKAAPYAFDVDKVWMEMNFNF